MTEAQAADLILWAKALFVTALAFGVTLLVVAVAAAVVHFWGRS